MHAIAWHIRKNSPERRVMYLSAEKFMYQFIKALRFKESLAFKEQFRSVDVLMIDDVQFISGKDSTQEEFFHTFNALHEAHKQIVLSSDRFPKDMPDIEERLRSRFEWGLIADLQPPDHDPPPPSFNETTTAIRDGLVRLRNETDRKSVV